MTNIHHRPIFDTNKVAAHYSEKDGVPVTYVCTSSANMGTVAYDIFYRETPHPEFGNHYFGLFTLDNNEIRITNADAIEKLDFDMVDVDGTLHYSQHRWDCYTVNDVSIDGGRAYLRRLGNLARPVVLMQVKNGKFIERLENENNPD